MQLLIKLIQKLSQGYTKSWQPIEALPEVESSSSNDISKMITQPNLPNKAENSERFETNKPPDLLGKLESIMSKQFIKLMDVDTLSDAMFMILSQNASEIVVVDTEDKFVGFITAEDILKEAPPTISSIPDAYKGKYYPLENSAVSVIKSLIKKRLKDIFCFHNSSLYLDRRTARIIDALDGLTNQYKPYASRLSIPILDKDKTVIGVVSYKKLIAYVRDFQVIEGQEYPGNFKQHSVIKPPYILYPSNTLADAYYAFERLPLDCILICEYQSKHLLGWVTRLRVRSLTHPIYSGLMQMPLQYVIEPVAKEQVVNCDANLQEIADRFVQHEIKFVIVVNEDNDRAKPQGMITQSDVLKFLFLNK